jgi:hypothetical protein
VPPLAEGGTGVPRSSPASARQAERRKSLGTALVTVPLTQSLVSILIAGSDASRARPSGSSALDPPDPAGSAGQGAGRARLTGAVKERAATAKRRPEGPSLTAAGRHPELKPSFACSAAVTKARPRLLAALHLGEASTRVRPNATDRPLWTPLRNRVRTVMFRSADSTPESRGLAGGSRQGGPAC